MTDKTQPDWQPPRRLLPDMEDLLREPFDSIALIIGDVAVLRRLDDDLIWTLMNHLDCIRVRLLRDLKGLAPRGDYFAPFEPSLPKAPRVHVAVAEFVLRNRAKAGERA